ncbi:helix-turn-helix transcriptional regulator [Brevundimonas sp.]|uniref:helix-turn-helix domain-containing protein n=1 Tax=Brevundimonas sp. TaxID=1871086 RepID=UPI00289742D9|nr:helix-turn-helix transcriptional regulator [Brevundimonas sp.]
MTKSNAAAVNDPVDIAIGARIRVRREARRITQAQLASAAGVTFQQIQKYERGVNRVAAARLLQIAHALRTTGADLLGELEAGDLDALALARPGASEVLEAFNRIGDVDARDAALTVLRAMASSQPTLRAAWATDQSARAEAH